MTDLFVAGVGNIGRRHIQAAYASENIGNFYCYDLFKPTLEEGLDKFLKDNNMDIGRFKKFFGLDEFSDQINDKSIVIIATTAKGRFELLKKIIKKKPKAVIIEKPVCQLPVDYLAISKLALENSVPVYVNFIAHAQTIYNDLAEEIKLSKSFIMTTKMPKWGISTVGIHQIELFLWLSREVNCKYNFTDRFIVYEQKRKGFFDFEGGIFIQGKNGSEAYISNIESDNGPSSIQFCLDTKTITVYESIGKYTVADKNGVQVHDLKIRFVSQYITEVLDDLIVKNTCYLPNLETSFESHNILFKNLEEKGHINLNIT